MNFNNNLPAWGNEGAEPSENLKANGFSPGYKPPASTFNWFFALMYACVNEIHTAISEHDDKINADGKVYVSALSQAPTLKNRDILLILEDNASLPENQSKV